MKMNIKIIGVMLIIGLICIGPVSAIKIVDKNTHTTYSTKYDCNGVLSYTTYKFNNYKFKTKAKIRWSNGKKGTMVLDLVKLTRTKLRVRMRSWADWGNTKQTFYPKTRWSVSKYYKKLMKPMLRRL
jgi:hypothetical protein